jgi:hypothetical protein
MLDILGIYIRCSIDNYRGVRGLFHLHVCALSRRAGYIFINHSVNAVADELDPCPLRTGSEFMTGQLAVNTNGLSVWGAVRIRVAASIIPEHPAAQFGLRRFS